jgi:hypothetical protein
MQGLSSLQNRHADVTGHTQVGLSVVDAKFEDIQLIGI